MKVPSHWPPAAVAPRHGEDLTVCASCGKVFDEKRDGCVYPAHPEPLGTTICLECEARYNDPAGVAFVLLSHFRPDVVAKWKAQREKEHGSTRGGVSLPPPGGAR